MKNSSLIGLAVVEAVGVVIGLLVAFGVPLTTGQVAAIGAAGSAAGGALAFVLWARTVDRAQVLEALVGTTVLAGEANDVVPNGSVVRELGQEPVPRRADPDEADIEAIEDADLARDY